MIRNLLAIAIIGWTLSSCVTSQKCNEKYPPVIRDTVIVENIDTVIIIDSVAFFFSDSAKSHPIQLSDVMDYIRDHPSSEWKDLVPTIHDEGEKKTSIQYKGDSLRANCETDSLKVIIRNLQAQVRIEQKQSIIYEQMYVDAQAEIKRMKIAQKPLLEEAKAAKWAQIKGVFLYSFLLLAAAIVLYLFIKYLR